MITHIYDFLEKSLIKFSEKTAFVEPFAKERKSLTKTLIFFLRN